VLLVATQSEALIVGYQSAAQLIRSRVLKYVAAVWDGSPGFRDAEVDRIVARILPVVQAGQIQLANLTDAYIGRTSVLAGVTWTPGVATKELLAYRGVDPQVVYRRPSVTVYTALAGGKSYNDAVAQGSRRMMSIIATDLQQAKNRQATASIGRSGFQWFRRVLTGRESCALCAIASTQRYTRGDLMPIHPGCDCDVEALNSPRDPGQVVDSDTLEGVHSKVEQLTGSVDRGGRLPDYRDLVVTNHHGELGPTLGFRSQHFDGPADIK